MKLNIPDDILIEIGKIAVTHALVDDTLAELINQILPISNAAGRCITAGMSHRQRIEVVGSLLIYAAGEKHVVVQRWHDVAKVLDEAEQQRNVVLHSSWLVPDVVDEANQVVRSKHRTKGKRGLVSEFEKLSRKYLQDLSERQGKAFFALARFEQALRDTDIATHPLERAVGVASGEGDLVDGG